MVSVGKGRWGFDFVDSKQKNIWKQIDFIVNLPHKVCNLLDMFYGLCLQKI
jgi:hypothetical protein